MTLQEKLTKALNDITELEKERDAANQAKTAAEASLEEAQGKVTALEGEKQTLEEEKATLAADLEKKTAKITELEQSIEAEKGKVTQLEGQLALSPAHLDLSNGRKPVSAGDGDTGDTQDIWDEYKAIKDPEKRSKFWRENKDAINAARREKIQAMKAESGE